MSIHKTAEGPGGTRPNFVQREFGLHGGNRVVEMHSVAEGHMPQLLVILGGPPKGSMDHHCAGQLLDGIFGNSVGTHATVMDGLPFSKK